MINLVCSYCESEEIYYLGESDGEDNFYCEDCRKDFAKSEAGWTEG